MNLRPRKAACTGLALRYNTLYYFFYMRGKLPVKIPDILVILLSIGLTAFSIFAVYMGPQDSLRVLIEGENENWIFPLDVDETVSVNGPIGTTVIRIYGNRACVESSPCENKTCVAQGHISIAGDWVACLPNNVFLLIEGSDESQNGLDGAVR